MELERRLDEVDSRLSGPRYICNCRTGCYHRPAFWNPEMPREMWRAGCGWRYGDSRFSTCSELPDSCDWHLVCEKCLPDERERLRTEAFWVEGEPDDLGALVLL